MLTTMLVFTADVLEEYINTYSGIPLYTSSIYTYMHVC